MLARFDSLELASNSLNTMENPPLAAVSSDFFPVDFGGGNTVANRRCSAMLAIRERWG